MGFVFFRFKKGLERASGRWGEKGGGWLACAEKTAVVKTKLTGIRGRLLGTFGAGGQDGTKKREVKTQNLLAGKIGILSQKKQAFNDTWFIWNRGFMRGSQELWRKFISTSVV